VEGKIGLIGVFDGYGGSVAADFVAENIEKYLTAEFEANVATGAIVSEERIYASCILALNNALIKMDVALARDTNPENQYLLENGTTASIRTS